MLDFIKNTKFFSSKGRVSRKEFWLFYIPYWLVCKVFIYFFAHLIVDIIPAELNALRIAIFIAVFLPLSIIAWNMQIKRLHDIGKTGNWFLLGLIPAIGGIVLAAILLRKGDPITNAYGEPPVGVKKEKREQVSPTEPTYPSVGEQMQVDLDKVEFSIPVVTRSKKKSFKVLSIVLAAFLIVSAGFNIHQAKSLQERTAKIAALESSLSEATDDPLRELYADAYFFYYFNAVVVTEPFKIYHHHDCHLIEGQDFLIYDKDVVRDMGYTPCSHCWKN